MAPQGLTRLSQILRDSQFEFLKHGEYHQQDIYRQVESQYPNLCDDGILCPHDPRPHRPEWHHQVRSALQSLKNRGVVLHPSRNHWVFGVEHILAEVKSDLNALHIEEEYFEGVRKERFSNYYERNPRLRTAAILYHGTTCIVCGFDFSETYGERGEGFIEAHHLRPVSLMSGDAQINPKTDMSVVCANCHRMIHRKRDRILTPEELAQIMDVAKNSR